MKAQTLINNVAARLSDTGNLRWSAPNLLAYLNEALRAIARVEPAATTKEWDVGLSAGARQSVPPDVYRFDGAIVNTNSDGPGDVINNADMATKDAFEPGWQYAETSTAVEECLYDAASPRTFFVSPPSPGGNHILVRGVATLSNITDAANTDLPVNDIYQPELELYMLYLAYDLNTDDGSKQQSLNYLNQFYQSFGLSAKVLQALEPAAKADTV